MITPLIENTTGKKEDSLYELSVTLLEPELKHPTVLNTLTL